MVRIQNTHVNFDPISYTYRDKHQVLNCYENVSHVDEPTGLHPFMFPWLDAAPGCRSVGASLITCTIRNESSFTIQEDSCWKLYGRSLRLKKIMFKTSFITFIHFQWSNVAVC